MKTRRKIFWIGLLFYAASFCLVALSETKYKSGTQPLFGFTCAHLAFVAPVVETGRVLQMRPFAYVCPLIRGICAN
jgi:hypothetical protein